MEKSLTMDHSSDLVWGILKIKGLAPESLQVLTLKRQSLTSSDKRGVGRLSQKTGYLVK